MSSQALVAKVPLQMGTLSSRMRVGWGERWVPSLAHLLYLLPLDLKECKGAGGNKTKTKTKNKKAASSPPASSLASSRAEALMSPAPPSPPGLAGEAHGGQVRGARGCKAACRIRGPGVGGQFPGWHGLSFTPPFPTQQQQWRAPAPQSLPTPPGSGLPGPPHARASFPGAPPGESQSVRPESPRSSQPSSVGPLAPAQWPGPRVSMYLSGREMHPAPQQPLPAPGWASPGGRGALGPGPATGAREGAAATGGRVAGRSEGHSPPHAPRAAPGVWG